jgi:hypothetical protein
MNSVVAHGQNLMEARKKGGVHLTPWSLSLSGTQLQLLLLLLEMVLLFLLDMWLGELFYRRRVWRGREGCMLCMLCFLLLLRLLLQQG